MYQIHGALCFYACTRLTSTEAFVRLPNAKLAETDSAPPKMLRKPTPPFFMHVDETSIRHD